MTAVTDLSTADVLRKAKQVLIERGWTREDYVNGHGNVCSYGAINVAISGDPRALSDRDGYGSGYLRKVIGTFAVARWNDSQKSVEPVLAAFDAAIALAESKASR